MNSYLRSIADAVCSNVNKEGYALPPFGDRGRQLSGGPSR